MRGQRTFLNLSADISYLDFEQTALYKIVKNGLDRGSLKLANNLDSSLDNGGLDIGRDSEFDSRIDKEAL